MRGLLLANSCRLAMNTLLPRGSCCVNLPHSGLVVPRPHLVQPQVGLSVRPGVPVPVVRRLGRPDRATPRIVPIRVHQSARLVRRRRHRPLPVRRVVGEAAPALDRQQPPAWVPQIRRARRTRLQTHPGEVVPVLGLGSRDAAAYPPTQAVVLERHALGVGRARAPRAPPPPVDALVGGVIGVAPLASPHPVQLCSATSRPYTHDA